MCEGKDHLPDDRDQRRQRPQIADPHAIGAYHEAPKAELHGVRTGRILSHE
jgi:hypothetical protein